jgi:hypothetical protein
MRAQQSRAGEAVAVPRVDDGERKPPAAWLALGLLVLVDVTCTLDTPADPTCASSAEWR